MATRRGRKTRGPALPAGDVPAGRKVLGFAMPAGLAVTIIAAVVLVPPYARLLETRYQRDVLAADLADAEAYAAAEQKLIDALPRDEVLTERLAESRLGLVPANEQRLAGEYGPDAPKPGRPRIRPHPRPDPPPRWLRYAGWRLSRPRLRRGLMLVAAGALFLAMMLSSPTIAAEQRQ